MRSYDLLPRAREDILDLAASASAYTDEARDLLTDTLFDGFERLSDFPDLGRDRSELAPGLRSFPINRLKVTVFYFTTAEGRDRVLIARVLRQERDVGPGAFPGGR